MPEFMPPNFVNPDYASPEQIAQQRAYAKALQDAAVSGGAKTGMGAIAAALMGFQGARGMNAANATEQASNLALQQGLQQAIQSKDLSKIASLTGNPRMTPAHIAMLMGVLEPRGAETYTTPGAAMSAPAPSILGGAGGATVPPMRPVTPGVPLPPANIPTGEPARPGQDNITSGNVTGVQYGPVQTGPLPPTAQLSPQRMQTLDTLQKKGQEYTRSNMFNVAGTEPQTDSLKQDQTFSAQAPLIKQTLGVIRDDIKTHGTEVSWGPQTETMTQLKRFAVNYAPGIFTPDQIAGIASADSLQKMSGILGTLLARQIGNAGGTDFSQQLGQGQVPNMHNSKEGAIALADMIEQGVDQTRKLGEEFRKLPNSVKTDPNFDYIGFRQGFFNKNPIINPITKNPITQDLLKMRGGESTAPSYGGGWGKVTRGQ